jgi:hypothetical protein
VTDIESNRVRPAPSNLWILRAQILLQRSVDDTDAQTRSRLNRARQNALTALDPPRSFRLDRWLAAGTVTAGMALVLWHGLARPPLDVPIAPAVHVAMTVPDAAQLAAVTAPDFELLVDQEQFEILQDLEFYAWLEANAADEG